MILFYITLGNILWVRFPFRQDVSEYSDKISMFGILIPISMVTMTIAGLAYCATTKVGLAFMQKRCKLLIQSRPRSNTL
ncbi:unnamed protein product [Vitrella brassicaformis CCMP3155]|uniref:Uncharacterized protein n=1 Tax=Vitrella brassicaformis (strain CCMP3155) TaxID=1169540 RepID=A0A0G4H6V6_VITBC|nr:unnamed protein product [Vitrella brassicaformis CCMP3155]|eukprot:CEM39587.1 unnamed protein product [Vitrella brassicaformis CCMP3155]